MKKILLVLAAAVSLVSCKKDDDNKKGGIFKGASVQVHDGKAWTWVKISKNDVPEQLAITLENKVLNSLPTTDEGGGHNAHQNNLVLPLHEKAIAVTPYKHVGLDWNPVGHEPEPIYTKSHFDMHFYMISNAERLAATNMQKILSAPDAAYIPEKHMSGAPVPTMGLHWLDVTSPELGGIIPFTQTFIYGSYDAKVIFHEPMITLEFLKNTNNFERSIPQPAKFSQAGYYPTKMKVVKHNGVTDVILEGFVQRAAN